MYGANILSIFFLLIAYQQISFSKGDIGICNNTRFDTRDAAVAVNCSHRQFTQIPNFIFEDKFKNGSGKICMNYNPLKSLPANSFANKVIGVPINQIIILRLCSCELVVINKDAFNGLENLQVLDLADNTLDNVPSAALANLKSLKRLSLNGNRIQQIASNAFPNLGNLNWLNLINCPITKIQDDAFVTLKTLRQLWLVDNKLSSLSTGALNGLPLDTDIHVGYNQTKCDCLLYELMSNDYRRLNNGALNASCLTQELSVCKPTIVSIKFDASNNTARCLAESKISGIRTLEVQLYSYPHTYPWENVYVPTELNDEGARTTQHIENNLQNSNELQQVKPAYPGMKYLCVARNNAGVTIKNSTFIN